MLFPETGNGDFDFAAFPGTRRNGESAKKNPFGCQGGTYVAPCNLAHRLRVGRATDFPT
jgi:hypothetical protein